MYHIFYWLLVATKWLTAKLHLRYVKESESEILEGRGVGHLTLTPRPCREGPVTDVVRVQSLAILHKEHIDVTTQFPVYQNRIWRQIPVVIKQLKLV